MFSTVIHAFTYISEIKDKSSTLQAHVPFDFKCEYWPLNNHMLMIVEMSLNIYYMCDYNTCILYLTEKLISVKNTF